MKSIKYMAVALMVTGAATASYAITVNWGTAQSTYLADSSGNYINGTDEIGTFTVAPTIGSPSLTNFVVFATDTSGGIADGVIGGGNGFASATRTAGATFSLAQIYFVMFDSTGTQEFIGCVSDSANSAWRFPADPDVVPLTSFDMDSFFANPGAGTSLAPGATIVYGSTGLDTTTPGGPYDQLRTQVIPEPSSIALVAVGLLGGFGLIRRRR